MFNHLRASMQIGLHPSKPVSVNDEYPSAYHNVAALLTYLRG